MEGVLDGSYADQRDNFGPQGAARGCRALAVQLLQRHAPSTKSTLDFKNLEQEKKLNASLIILMFITYVNDTIL